MSRPRTKGEALTIRLSTHHDEILRLCAEQAGVPPGQMATAMLEEALEPAPPRRSRGRTTTHSETCKCPICTGATKSVAKK